MNELKVNGTQKFMGIDIPIVEGGFCKDQKVILTKTVAEIHNQPLKKINQLIKDNIEEFEIGVDLLDLKSGYLESTEFLNGGQDAVTASKKLTEIEVEEAKKPLIEKNDTLNTENDLLAQKNLERADRPLINSIIRAYAASIGGNFGKAWNDFKKELLYKHSINLNSRITNYLNISGKKTKPKTLDMLDDSELSSAISTAVSLCRENEVDIDYLLNNKAS